MNLNLSTRRNPLAKAVQGMTLPELLVSVGVGSMVLAIMAILFVTSTRSLATMGSYVNMDSNSRNALDHMSLEIRQAGGLTQFSPTHLSFTQQGQTNSFLVYHWDSTTRQLTEWKTGNATTNILLNQCDQLTFSLYNAAFGPTTNLVTSKGLSVKWKCSRSVLGSQNTTEDMQQALIVIRNKPVS